MGPAKGSILEESEMSHSRACGMREKTKAINTGESFSRKTHSSQQAEGIKMRTRASLGREGESFLSSAT